MGERLPKLGVTWMNTDN
uniref:Uncharacterized protein n=1 Tax=Arundo donax TaxID=35708 RepID=A0A0A9F828_ARUDO